MNVVGAEEVLEPEYLDLLERELRREVFHDQSSILKLDHLRVATEHSSLGGC